MKKLIGFGASSMQGVGDSQGGFFSRLASTGAFPDLQFINHGIGGNTLAQMIKRLPATLQIGPYDIVVLFGCNDLPRKDDGQPERRSTLEEYTRRANQLLPAVKGRRSLFVSSFAVSAKATGIDPVDFEAYMNVALDAARKAGYETWDLYRESMEKAPGFLAADGLHFKDEGHTYIASRLNTWLSGLSME